ncbi:MAG TPA: phosphotransferase family protein [Trebonia sp.]|jgi:aminoglycoside phosphotransferase (APT) family kinase protein
MRPGAAGDAALPALAAWVAARLTEDSGTAVAQVHVTTPARAGVGQSSDTSLFQARWTERGRPQTADLVLRRQPGYDGIFLRPDAGHEFAVITALAGYPAVPVPRTRWVERDPAVLGTPFFVMDQVPGIVPAGRPSIHVTGWLTTLTPGQRRTAWQSSVDAIAALHDVPWRQSHSFIAAGYPLPDADAESGLSLYLRRMAEWYHWTAAGRVYPVTDAALAYLLEHAPGATSAPPVLAWGDARPGNIIFDPRRCVPVALIDWEIATIAPPEADIAHWLVFDDFATAAAGVAPLPGYATRDEIIGRYEATSGRRLGDVGYFEILQSFFLATTLIRQADARVQRGELSAGTRMGHDNTVTQMLARRLGLPVPELSADYLSHRAGRRPPPASAEPTAAAAPAPVPQRPGIAAPTPKAG